MRPDQRVARDVSRHEIPLGPGELLTVTAKNVRTTHRGCLWESQTTKEGVVCPKSGLRLGHRQRRLQIRWLR